jgi:hypothetical protein
MSKAELRGACPVISNPGVAAETAPTTITSTVIDRRYKNHSRPQTIATDVVRLPPMLKVRNFFTFSI